ncbi:MAG TPA: hypothetical protein ENN09_03600, partial [Planctomycetes bacterium]|nr:hypothetical protein [Planctomycetota bacterium]
MTMKQALLFSAALLACGAAGCAPEAKTPDAARVTAAAAPSVQPAVETPPVDAMQPVRGRARAVYVAQGPVIDGTLDDPVWQASPPWQMGPSVKDEPARYRTFARVLFDDRNVYVGVFCGEPDTEGLVAAATLRDSEVWQDDSVEVFIRPDPDEPYYQLVVNPRGTLMDLSADGSRRSLAWDSSAEVKAAVQPGASWTAAFRIPMREISAYVGENQAWAMNICRTRYARGGDTVQEYTWPVMSRRSYHSVNDWGVVEGINVPLQPDGVTRTRSAPLPGPPVSEKGTWRGGVLVYRRASFDSHMDGFEASGDAKLSLTDDSAGGCALMSVCNEAWAGPQLKLNIAGSKDLKAAFLAKGSGFPRAAMNVYDAAARDNTTSYAYRILRDGEWTPVVYYLDSFRYNSSSRGFVAPETEYNLLRFFGPEGGSLIMDNFAVYRGNDREPPQQVAGLTAEATSEGIMLKWYPAEDNGGVMLYMVYRGIPGEEAAEKVAEVHVPHWLDNNVSQNTTYYYFVSACDFEENVGKPSDMASATAINRSEYGVLTQEGMDRVSYAPHVREVHQRGKG